MGFFFFWVGRNFQHLEVIDRLVLNAHRPKVWGLDQESAEPDRNGNFWGRTIAREGRARNAEHERTQQQKRTRASESARRHGERRDHAGGLGA